jgi:hypothetical protein
MEIRTRIYPNTKQKCSLINRLFLTSAVVATPFLSSGSHGWSLCIALAFGDEARRMLKGGSRWRWQLPHLPKRWNIFNSRRGFSPKAEVTHQLFFYFMVLCHLPVSIIRTCRLQNYNYICGFPCVWNLVSVCGRNMDWECLRKKALRRVFGIKKDKVTEEWIKMHSKEFQAFTKAKDQILVSVWERDGVYFITQKEIRIKP